MKTLLLCLLAFLAAGVAEAADPPAVLPYFGAYRAKEYNGVKNEYSHRFFYPTINTEPSVKLKHEDGAAFRTLNFNFEVPVEKEDGSIHLKFLFPEFPLDGAVVKETGTGLELRFDGRIQEFKATPLGDFWHSCEAHYTAKLTRVSELILRIELDKQTVKPCASEKHDILAERVPQLR